MTEFVYAENSSPPITKVNGDPVTKAIVPSSLSLLSEAVTMNTTMLTPPCITPTTISTNCSSKVSTPSPVPVSAAAAAAALLTNPSFSSFRQLAELWHPHAYNSATKRPTPFSIADILKERNTIEQNTHSRPEHYSRNLHHVFSPLNIQNLPYRLSESTTSLGLLPELTNALAQHMVASNLQMHQPFLAIDSSEENEKQSISPE